ncbi:MAG: HAD family phosphatase [Gammaproteobacteria bacterium]|nr:MAG: HAD family phosphatase [Gammaproteobacteria bacterium]
MRRVATGGKDAMHPRHPPSRDLRVILFDYGGVLAEEGFRDGLRRLAREQGLDPEGVFRAGMDAVYDSGFVLGRGTEADFWQRLRARTGLQGKDAELTRRILEGFVVRPWMIEAVDRLRTDGYRTAILSDQTHWLDTLVERDGLAPHFDRIYNSYHLGKGKRDPSVFDDVVRDLGVAPAQVLFIDDQPGNVARARRRGLRGWVYTDRAGFEALMARLLENTREGNWRARKDSNLRPPGS